jgi:copper chaperone CopZ
MLIVIIGFLGALSISKSPAATAPQMRIVSIPVEGMSCVSCAARVKGALKAIQGVDKVEVSLERREVTVRFSPEKVTPELLEATINRLGYQAGKPRSGEAR